MKGKVPKMPRRKESPIKDEFMTWFESLTVESQREALQVAVKIKQESFGSIVTGEMVIDGSLHIPPGSDSIFLLN